MTSKRLKNKKEEKKNQEEKPTVLPFFLFKLMLKNLFLFIIAYVLGQMLTEENNVEEKKSHRYIIRYI